MEKVDNNDLGMVQELSQVVTVVATTKAPHLNWRSIVCSDDNGCMVCTGNPYNPLQSISCKCPLKPSNNMALRVVFMNQVFTDKMHLQLIRKSNGDKWEKWLRSHFYSHFPSFGPPNFAVITNETIRNRVCSCMEEVCKKHDLPYLVFDESAKRYVLTVSRGFETPNALSPYEKRVIKMVQELASALEELAPQRDDRIQQLNAKKISLTGREEMMRLGVPSNGRRAWVFATPPQSSSSATASSQHNNRNEDEAIVALNRPPISAMLRTYNNLQPITDVSGSPPTDPLYKKSIGVKRSASYRAQEDGEITSILGALMGDPEERKRRIAVEESKAASMEAQTKLMTASMEAQTKLMTASMETQTKLMGNMMIMFMQYMMSNRANEGGALSHPPQVQHFLTTPSPHQTFSTSNHSSWASSNNSSSNYSSIYFPTMNDEEN